MNEKSETNRFSSTLRGIAEKIRQGSRLDFEDGMAMEKSAELMQIGQLAEQVTRERCGGEVFYCVNRHIHYTNICSMRCSFCGFSREVSQADSYVLTAEEVAEQAREAVERGATEVHIVGGVNPDLPFDYYLNLLGEIRRACPELHIKAFTAVEILDLAGKAGLSIKATLEKLLQAGLGSLPGGGAEILDEQYFKRNCPRKFSPEQWLEVHGTAHRLGVMTNATMLFGFNETAVQRIRHLLRLRELQDESVRGKVGRFQCFVPLVYVPVKPNSKSNGKRNSTDEQKLDSKFYSERFNVVSELKTVAISRLMLDNFEHVKAFWPMLGVNLAQIALCFGADDLDGTVQQYQIVEKKDGRETDNLDAETICRLVMETGRVAVQRDPLYRPVLS
ncbi:MAG: CofH family radical SAM protein [Sedimentisphaerales bacterium]|nr:CofH family radical SAM protein [Sedimentisphaerales bacterium]